MKQENTKDNLIELIKACDSWYMYLPTVYAICKKFEK